MLLICAVAILGCTTTLRAQNDPMWKEFIEAINTMNGSETEAVEQQLAAMGLKTRFTVSYDSVRNEVLMVFELFSQEIFDAMDMQVLKATQATSTVASWKQEGVLTESLDMLEKHDCNFRVIVKYVDKWNKIKLKESVITPEEFRKAAKNAGLL